MVETPLMKQYIEMKAVHPDAILLFRVGDFYETFSDDAITASEILGITLTRRANGSAQYVELAGFPHHALDTYLPKLVRSGKRVAICEQLEDPKLTKKLVKRGITELVTPGVSIDDNILDHKENNFLAGVHFGKNGTCGVAFLDISTGEFLTAEGNYDYIDKLLGNFQPKEILFERSKRKIFEEHFGNRYFTFELEDWIFTEEAATERLLRHFGTKNLKGFGVQNLKMGIIASGALLHYLDITQHTHISHILSLSRIEADRYVRLDKFTVRSLELLSTMNEGGKSLLDIIDRTVCPMGARLLKRWITFPLKETGPIRDRQDVVEFFFRHPDAKELIDRQLCLIGDLERLISKVAVGRITPRETVQLRVALAAIEPIRDCCQSADDEVLQRIAAQLNPCTLIRDRIEREISPDAPSLTNRGGIIAKGVNAELDELREISGSGKDYLLHLQQRESERTGIPSLKIGYNNVFGYYIEVSNSYKSMVPETYIRKQTLTSGERYITQELKELESKILGAHERLIALEHRLFSELLETIGGQLDRIQRTANAVAELDVLAALAQVAAENNYCRPVVDDSDELTITEGRHPVVEQMLKGSLFVPNDTRLNCTTDRCLIITGPNMAGKSTYMRQNALIALMAQIGSFVPASSCHVGVVDAIFTRIGASDDLAAGQSTFMVEMTEVAEILKNATPKSLVVLDEIGRGTSTFDGMSIARAVVEHISDPAKGLGCKTLFATHYHELTDLEGAIEGVKNYNIAVKKRGEDITFLRRIIRGPADDSYGIEVAKLAGLPGTVTRRAHEVLRTLEASAPKNKVEQMDFDALQEYSSPAVPSEMMEKLEALDVETLTPIEALNFLYELKKTLSGSLNG